jgi:radical SAM protein with 4Fe4S-binding SPASM domain
MHILTLPAVLALELTPACNNHCPGCSNVYAAHREGQPPLSASEWCDLLAPFIDEVVQIRLTGGEPTLHPGFFEIAAWLAEREAFVTLFTNGRWPDPHALVNRLRGMRNLSGLLVSLHGPDADSHEAFARVPGAFAETVANVRLAVEAGIPVALSTVITCRSWDRLAGVVALAHELGAGHVAINRYIGGHLPGVEPTDDQLRAAIRSTQALIEAGEPVKYGIGVPQCFLSNASEGCWAGVAYASIDPWGRLRPCAHSPTIVGSLRERSLADLWQGAAMQRWRASTMPAGCPSCAAYPACHGGCRAVQELRADGRDPLRGDPLAAFAPQERAIDLPAEGRPVARVRARRELFGYALLGCGQVLPVREEALALVQACTGRQTFAELAEYFGEGGLELLGEMWSLGMLDLA